MPLKTVGLLSPGDMGHVVGNVLVTHGLRVITCLQGRSERTRALAEKGKIEDVPTYQTLVNEAEIILSIMVPAEAKGASQAVADTLAETKTDLTYVDCNAIAPTNHAPTRRNHHQSRWSFCRCVDYRSATQKTGGDPLLRLRHLRQRF